MKWSAGRTSDRARGPAQLPSTTSPPRSWALCWGNHDRHPTRRSTQRAAQARWHTRAHAWRGARCRGAAASDSRERASVEIESLLQHLRAKRDGHRRAHGLTGEAAGGAERRCSPVRRGRRCSGRSGAAQQSEGRTALKGAARDGAGTLARRTPTSEVGGCQAPLSKRAESSTNCSFGSRRAPMRIASAKNRIRSGIRKKGAVRYLYGGGVSDAQRSTSRSGAGRRTATAARNPLLPIALQTKGAASPAGAERHPRTQSARRTERLGRRRCVRPVDSSLPSFARDRLPRAGRGGSAPCTASCPGQTARYRSVDSGKDASKEHVDSKSHSLPGSSRACPVSMSHSQMSAPGTHM